MASGRRPQRPHTIHVDTDDPVNAYPCGPGSGPNSGATATTWVAEQELIREILMVAQGLNGKLIVMDPTKENRFLINPQYSASIHPSQRSLVERLTNLGWLYQKINRYCQSIARDTSHGPVCQSFASALKEELLEFARLVTIVSQQLSQQMLTSCGRQATSAPVAAAATPLLPTANGNGVASNNGEEVPLVTLQRLFVWTFDWYFKLKSLAVLVDYCRGKRGGSLANSVYKSMHQGDALIRECVTRILSQVALPIRKMLHQWIFYGELDDPYAEFFIKKASSASMATNGGGSNMNISGNIHGGEAVDGGHQILTTAPTGFNWLDKYVINENMMPGFIDQLQANKILATGKAIDLLRQVCGDQVASTVNGYEDMKQAFAATSVECLFRKQSFSDREQGEFDRQLDQAYQEVSKKALEIMFIKFKLMDHLTGLRKYMLLGQGDFIRHLMDLLRPELDKPAVSCRFHNVVPALEQAIRSTNAQFDDVDVTSCLDCRLTERQVDESGWEIFTLGYRVQGPLAAILTPQCMTHYGRLFRSLWRTKHMEYVLTSLWSELTEHSRSIKLIPALNSTYHASHILLSEMTHLIQQLEYYLTFEVMECSWAELSDKIKSAKDIEQLIAAHQAFLCTVTRKSLIDGDLSQHIGEQLRAVFETIIAFQATETTLFKVTELEVEERRRFTEQHRGHVDILAQRTESERRLKFEDEMVPKLKIKIGSLSRTYQDMVQKLLLQLAEHEDSDIRFLSFRLDFNEHYKRRDKRLETSFTYSRIRN